MADLNQATTTPPEPPPPPPPPPPPEEQARNIARTGDEEQIRNFLEQNPGQQQAVLDELALSNPGLIHNVAGPAAPAPDAQLQPPGVVPYTPPQPKAVSEQIGDLQETVQTYGGKHALETVDKWATDGINSIRTDIPVLSQGASVGRAVLGFGKDLVVGFGHLGYMVSPQGQIDRALGNSKTQAEILEGKTTPEAELNKQWETIKAIPGAIVKPVTDPWNRGDYVESVTRGVIEVASIVLPFTKAGKAGTVGNVSDDVARVGSKVDDIARTNPADDLAKNGNKVDDASKAAKAKQITGVEAKAAEIISDFSPVLKSDIEALQKAGWTVEVGEAGKGSFADRTAKRIVIDANEKGTQAASVISHEVGHAKFKPAIDYSSKDAFLKSALADEGEAILRNMETRAEILKSGGPDIGVRGSQATKYDEIYQQYLKDGDRTAARNKIGEIVGEKEITSTTKQPYKDYYGDWYDKNVKPKQPSSVPPTSGRVTDPGNRIGEVASYVDDSVVPARYANDVRFSDLAKDPAHGGAVTPKTRAEAMAGLEAESQGLVKGPIKRGPAEIEFFDSKGNPWDVKTPESPPSGATWTFKPDQVGKSIQKELTAKGTPPGTFPNEVTGAAADRQIILNTSYMSKADHQALWNWLNGNLTPEQLSRIVEVNIKP